MRDYAGEAALQQSQLDVLGAQLALIEAREARLEFMDVHASEMEGDACWRQAAIDLSDSVGELTHQLQQRQQDLLQLQVNSLHLLQCNMAF